MVAQHSYGYSPEGNVLIKRKHQAGYYFAAFAFVLLAGCYLFVLHNVVVYGC